MAGKTKQRNRPGQYAVFVHDSRKHSFFRGSFHSLTGALKQLKAARVKGYGQNSFIATEGNAFPYTNRIGPVREDPNDHWAYKYCEPNTGDVITMFIEKRPLDFGDGPAVPSLKEDLESGKMAEEVSKMAIY